MINLSPAGDEEIVTGEEVTEDTGLSTDFSQDDCQAVAVELNQKGDYFTCPYSVSQTPQFSKPAESVQPVMRSTQCKILACGDSDKPMCPSERESEQHNEDLTSRVRQAMNTDVSLKGSEEEAVKNDSPVVLSEEDFDIQGVLEDSQPVASETFGSLDCISESEPCTPEQQTEESVEETVHASLNTSSPAQTSSHQE